MTKLTIFGILLLTLIYSCSQKSYIYKLDGSYAVTQVENYFLKDSTMIRGVIKDKKSTLPLEGGNIAIKGMNLGTSTDATGYFVVKIPTGKHKVCAGYVGYTSLCSKEINFHANEIVTIDFYLGTTIQVEQKKK